MELFSAEANSLQSMVGEWLKKPDHEVEATFGKGGRVDSSTFMAVAQRLRSKGYRAAAPEDMLTIVTPEHVRITLSSLAVITQYCADDDLATKPFRAMFKDRATADSKVDLEDYETRIKACSERPMVRDDAVVKRLLETWAEQRKGFRMIRRWSFEADGLRIDMSIVRATKKDPTGTYKWQRRFRDQDVVKQEPTYEIEVELLRKEGDSVETAMKRLVRGVGEVLRGVQRNTLLIRNSQRTKVLGAYKELTGTDQFRGPALMPLMRANFDKERQKGVGNIRDGYNVTDKADGLRALGFVDGAGEFFLIDMGMVVYRTGLQRPDLRLSLVDGEWVTKTKDKPPKAMNQFLVFDIFYATDKRDVSQFPFQPGAVAPDLAVGPAVEGEAGAGAGAAVAAAAPRPPEDSRHAQLKLWVETWNKAPGPKVTAAGVTMTNKLQVAMKEYMFATAGNDGILRLASRVWRAARNYYTDGLIFTPNAAPLPREPAATFKTQFKWKPPHDNTIDFLVRFEKERDKKIDSIRTGVKPDTGATISFKTARLYVGNRLENPRDVILNKKPLPKDAQNYRGRMGKDYRPVLFTPQEFPDPFANVCYMELLTDPDTGVQYVKTGEPGEPGEPIQDNTIVEMAYDPSQEPGWRWKALRLRTDKTERFQRGTVTRTLNSAMTADGVWTSIYDPVTESMITGISDGPTQEELAIFGEDMGMRDLAARRYFDRKAATVDQALAKPIAQFHNRWVKERILYPAGLSGAGKVLLDLACGQANDLHIWRRVGVEFVLGVDYAAQNIMDPTDGAWARYLSVAQQAGGVDRMETMAFAIANAAKPLANPPAKNGGTEEDKDILRSVFGHTKPIGTVPQFIAEECASRLKTGADCVSCMFALHYFFETPEALNGLLRNISDGLKVGGYFIGCCFDGDKLFAALREKAKGESITGAVGDKILWQITKQYDVEDLMEGDGRGIGVGVDVLFNSIGMGHREYLVPFRLLEEKMRLVGCELLSATELKELGLPSSTGMFEDAWLAAKKAKQEFKISDVGREFSFFNRWFIFKRKRQDTIAAAVVAEAAEAAIAEGAPGAANERPAGAPAGAPAAAAPVNAGRAAALQQAAKQRAADATAVQRNRAAEAAKIINDAAPGAPGAAAAGPAGTPERTVPVAAGPAAAPAAAAAAAKVYEPGEIFLFYTDAAVRDSLKIKDAGAARWLAPSAPFPIPDPDDDKVVYPTMEHFLGGMRVKLATTRKELAPNLFGREGTIHTKFLHDRLVESNGGTKPLPEERDHAYTKLEMAAVKEAMRPPALKKLGAIVNEASWATARDEMMRYALNYRWERDARFRRIIEAARGQNKMLLYYTPGASTSNVGGVYRRESGRIDGENKIGQIMMELAGYPK